MFHSAVKTLALVLSLLVAASPLPAEELTLEPGDQSGTVHFLWHASLTDVGARSHRLSDTASFDRAFAKALIDHLEIQEIRELDSDSSLPFNYVIPPRADVDSPLRDVTWYYPHPIPAGGRARVQIRGILFAPRVFNGDSTRVQVNYVSKAECFVVLPVGFAVTYCSSPIVIHEKNAHTVCAFSLPDISLIARNVCTPASPAAMPVISRDSNAVPIHSRLPLRVRNCPDPGLLDAAARSLGGSIPVLFDAYDSQITSTPPDLLDLTPGRSLIWRIDHIVIRGLDHFERIASSLPIGHPVTLHYVRTTDQGAVAPAGSVQVTVEADESGPR